MKDYLCSLCVHKDVITYCNNCVDLDLYYPTKKEQQIKIHTKWDDLETSGIDVIEDAKKAFKKLKGNNNIHFSEEFLLAPKWLNKKVNK